MLGRVTFQKTSRRLAPKVSAASSSEKSMDSRTGINSLTTKGIVTNRVASAIPATKLWSAWLERSFSAGYQHGLNEVPVLAWKGKDNVEACGAQDWGEPALSTIQQHQHQTCKAIETCNKRTSTEN